MPSLPRALGALSTATLALWSVPYAVCFQGERYPAFILARADLRAPHNAQALAADKHGILDGHSDFGNEINWCLVAPENLHQGGEIILVPEHKLYQYTRAQENMKSDVGQLLSARRDDQLIPGKPSHLVVERMRWWWPHTVDEGILGWNKTSIMYQVPLPLQSNGKGVREEQPMVQLRKPIVSAYEDKKAIWPIPPMIGVPVAHANEPRTAQSFVYRPNLKDLNKLDWMFCRIDPVTNRVRELNHGNGHPFIWGMTYRANTQGKSGADFYACLNLETRTTYLAYRSDAPVLGAIDRTPPNCFILQDLRFSRRLLRKLPSWNPPEASVAETHTHPKAPRGDGYIKPNIGEPGLEKHIRPDESQRRELPLKNYREALPNVLPADPFFGQQAPGPVHEAFLSRFQRYDTSHPYGLYDSRPGPDFSERQLYQTPPDQEEGPVKYEHMKHEDIKHEHVKHEDMKHEHVNYEDTKHEHQSHSLEQTEERIKLEQMKEEQAVKSEVKVKEDEQPDDAEGEHEDPPQQNWMVHEGRLLADPRYTLDRVVNAFGVTDMSPFSRDTIMRLKMILREMYQQLRRHG